MALFNLTLSPALPSSRRRRPDGWLLLVLALAVLAMAPILAVLGVALQPSGDLWAHLFDTLLGRYALVSAQLCLLVGAGVLVVGVGTAWLVTTCRFPGRGVLEWALLLPLAMPAYLAAYAYTDLLEYAGPLQTMLREAFGWGRADYWFPEVRSMGGAALFMTLVLYPYVYLLTRAAFLEQSAALLEAARSMGRGPWRVFLTVALPLARPAIVVGVLLALMETLNDFGTVDYFAVPTFTVGIYRVWFGMGNVTGAAQLASGLVAVVVALIWLERRARRNRRFGSGESRGQPFSRIILRGPRAWLALLACAAPVLLGFAVPAAVLLHSALGRWSAVDGAQLGLLTLNSLMVSTLVAVVCLAVGVMLAYGHRLRPRPLVAVSVRLASLGYAMPGAVLAIGVIIPAAWLDARVIAWVEAATGHKLPLLLSGTLAALVFACAVRFLPLAEGAIASGLTKITPRMDDAARSLGESAAGALRRVHLPLLRGSALTAVLLVFVDCMKELPMTLILRPFNFSTLATHVYEYASSEMFRDAAPAALAIVVAGLLPVILLSREIARPRTGFRQGRDGHAPPTGEETQWYAQ